MKKVKHVSLGDKVFAKVKGYPAWPARVDEDLGKKYKVYFYGTGETGTVKAEDLFSYVEHKDQFVKSLKRKDYNDAIEEIEAAIAQDGLSMDEREEEEPAEIEREEEIKRGLKRKLSVDSTSGAEAKRKNVPARMTESKKLNVSAPSKASAKASEALESEASEGRKSPESVLSDDENDELERNNSSNNNKIEIRRDSEKHDSSSDEEMENELLQGKRALESKPTKFKVVTPHTLREICAEFEEAVKDAEKGNEKPDEDSYIPQNEVLLTRIKADKYVGIKLNRNKPDETFETEVERLRWKESDARTALELKEKIEEGSLKPEDKPELFEFNLELTDEQLKDAVRDRIMERKRTKLKFLKVEATLVELDASIKTNLALDKADPKEALKGLDVMLNLKIEPLMLKKHSHVMEMVKRLRRYIGNVKEWKLQGKELEDFKKDAELIRAKADTIYSKFRALFTVPEDKTFWEVFNDECEKFKLLTKDMPENQMFILCADPGSHQAILDELDDQEELKLLSDKKENKIQDKENLSQVMNSDETIADLSAENSHTSTDSHG